MSNFWNLPPAPPSLPTVLDAIREVAIERDLRARLAAIEELAYYARRDGHSIAVAKSGGVTVDAWIVKGYQPTQMFIIDQDKLSFTP